MSLMRLLSSGRSWVGLKESTRYVMTDPRAMPKFGSDKNPFLSASKKPDPVRMPEPPGSDKVAAEVNHAPYKHFWNRQQKVENPKGIPAQSPGLRGTSYPGITDQTASTLKGLRHRGRIALVLLAKCAPSRLLSIAIHSGRNLPQGTVLIFRRLNSLVPRRHSRPRTAAIASFARGPLQGELSLDKIKVVRNDLSDVDLEVVRRSEKSPAAAPLMPDAPARTDQESDGAAWTPATAGLIGASKI
jgi:hypothetical protein